MGGTEDAGEKIRAIDEKIRREYEMVVAPMVVDMAGFTSRTRQFGILHYLSMIEMMRITLLPIVEEGGGTPVKVEADNLFAYFKSPSAALRAVSKIGRALRTVNEDVDDAYRIDLSIGIGFGPILVTQMDMWGGEFNVACKLGEDLAQTGEVVLTENARRKIRSEKIQFKERSYVVGGDVLNGYSVPLGAL